MCLKKLKNAKILKRNKLFLQKKHIENKQQTSTACFRFTRLHLLLVKRLK